MSDSVQSEVAMDLVSVNTVTMERMRRTVDRHSINVWSFVYAAELSEMQDH